MRPMILLTLLLFAAAASFADSTRLSFTVIGIDCEHCAPPILRAIKSVDGVAEPKLDWKKGEASVTVDESFDKSRIRTALTNLGYEVIFPGEKVKGIEPLPADVRKTLDIVTFAEGKRFDVKKLMVPGKITIVDFYADWCGPCNVLDARLQHLVAANKDIAVRRINMGKWDTPAARQATSEFRAEALPYVRIYDAAGKLVGVPRGGMWDEVLAAIEKARS